MQTRAKMVAALMPLIEESIKAADWNSDEWLTPLWRFDIIDGKSRYGYSLGSAPNRLAPLPKYRPVFLDGGVGELVDDYPLPGNLFVIAYYSRGGSETSAHSDLYNPADKSVEKWAEEFIREAKMRIISLDPRA
jgi:hypothetical protein